MCMPGSLLSVFVIHVRSVLVLPAVRPRGPTHDALEANHEIVAVLEDVLGVVNEVGKLLTLVGVDVALRSSDHRSSRAEWIGSAEHGVASSYDFVAFGWCPSNKISRFLQTDLGCSVMLRGDPSVELIQSFWKRLLDFPGVVLDSLKFAG